MKKGKESLCNATHMRQSTRDLIWCNTSLFLFKEFVTYFSAIWNVRLYVHITSYLKSSIVSACSQHLNIFQACDYHCCTHAATVPKLVHNAIRLAP